MLIFHNTNNTSNRRGKVDSIAKKKKKKNYKSVGNQRPGIITIKASDQERQKTYNKATRESKKISMKNTQFLKELGLKVKPRQ